MDYLLFEPGPFGFPQARLSVLAPLRSGALLWRPPVGHPQPAWVAHGRLYSRARYALRDAMALGGVGPQGALLAPAYHCRTMLDPAIALGAPVLLYRLNPDLTPDLGDIARQLATAAVPVKSVLAPHYFGLRQDLQPLAALCRSHGAELIEDCAHALPLRAPANGMGSTGTWCVASPYKFFPCEDGGALWSGQGTPLPPLPALRRPALRQELGQLRSLRARAARRVDGALPSAPTPGPGDLNDTQRQAMARQAQQAGPSPDYLRGRETLACSAVSRWIIGHTDVDAIIRRRRAHYAHWVDAVRDLPQVRPLQPVLGPDDTPYMVPLLLADPLRHFGALKHAGMPMWRWDSLARSACTTSAGYRLHLVQLPCHQALTPTELDWLVGTLRAVVTEGRPATAGSPA